MQFKNPANGHIESPSTPWLWMFLFGGIYLVIAGLWRGLIAWLILATMFYGSLGAAGTLPVIIMNIVYAGLAGGMVRANYLRKGWIEVGDETEQAIEQNPATEPLAAPTTKKCPLCAEEIKAEAIKCKHCGSLIPTE